MRLFGKKAFGRVQRYRAERYRVAAWHLAQAIVALEQAGPEPDSGQLEEAEVLEVNSVNQIAQWRDSLSIAIRLLYDKAKEL